MSKQIRKFCDFCRCEIEEEGSIEFPASVLTEKHGVFGWFSAKLHICAYCRMILCEKKKGGH